MIRYIAELVGTLVLCGLLFWACVEWGKAEDQDREEMKQEIKEELRREMEQ